MSYQVRAAEKRDIPSLKSLLKDFSKFYGSAMPLYGDDAYIEAYLDMFIGTHLMLVAESEESEVVGMIAGFMAPHIYNPQIRTLTEAAWWVAEEHRMSKAGKLLLDSFVEFGKENVDWIIATLEHDSPVGDEVFLKRGFKHKERSFILEVR